MKDRDGKQPSDVDGDGSDPAANDLKPSTKRVRMEIQEQETVILSVRARECLNKIDKSLRFNLPPKLHRRARQLALSLNRRKYHHKNRSVALKRMESNL